MKRGFLIASACVLLSTPYAASAQQLIPMRVPAQGSLTTPAADENPLVGSVAEMEDVPSGRSAKRAVLGKAVTNDAKENVGAIDDIIIMPGDFASFAIIDVGRFLGISRRRVAIPMRKLQLRNHEWILSGATKNGLKALPPFEYAR